MTAVSHRISRFVRQRGLSVPTFLYGTAWKEDRTEALTRLALTSGFTGFDTANQRRHYYEEGVGEAVRQVLKEGIIKRSDIFLQTKFTFASSQDHRLPYDPHADYSTQVEQSLQSSLAHLQTDYLDSYILHGPATGRGLTEADWAVWRAMENFQKSGVVRLIGVSNVDFKQLQILIEKSDIKPAFVQNRCFARTQWDADIRRLCKDNSILYQGFSLLTANLNEIDRPEIHQIAKRAGCSVAQAVFRFALQTGIIPLTGTACQSHMTEDLAVYDIELEPAEIETIERIAL